MKLQVQDIKISLSGRSILKGIQAEMPQKQFIGIIGPNGSGKSTLLKCIYRVLKPDNGAVYLDGKNLSQFSYRESAKKMAVVAQHNYYNFDFSVEDVVLMGRSPHKRSLERDTAEDYEIVSQSLKEVGMEEFRNRSFSTLSGGEQQRVILARALAQQTPCLILDEPTNHLDIKYQLQLMDIVKNLNRTILSAIHDLNIALMYCDMIYVVKDGQLIAQGVPEQVLTQRLIQEVYQVDAEILRDRFGMAHILYHPALRKERENDDETGNA